MDRMMNRQVIDRLHALSEGLRYGSIHLVVHDGKVVQIERAEKVRLDKEEKL